MTKTKRNTPSTPKAEIALYGARTCGFGYLACLPGADGRTRFVGGDGEPHEAWALTDCLFRAKEDLRGAGIQEQDLVAIFAPGGERMTVQALHAISYFGARRVAARAGLPDQRLRADGGRVDRARRDTVDAKRAELMAGSSVKVLSLGGGLDSFAMLLDALERGEWPDMVVFVDVADPDHQEPGEWPGTYRHVEEVVRPLCAREGIEFHVLDGDRYPVRDARSLFGWMRARHQIPVAGPGRICTRIAKTERFERWLDDRFQPGDDVEVWIGFEAGEEARAANDPNVGHAGWTSRGVRRRNRFPLIERGLCRCRCAALVRAAGFPVPRKSACVFCPYSTRRDFQGLARELPDVFAEVVELEASKPLTSKGVKLSIMGFRSRRRRPDGTVTEPKGTPLPLYVAGVDRTRTPPCGVCGAAEKATKASGCGWLA